MNKAKRPQTAEETERNAKWNIKEEGVEKRKSSCLENLGDWVKEDEAREGQTEKEQEKEGGINKEN